MFHNSTNLEQKKKNPNIFLLKKMSGLKITNLKERGWAL